MNSIADPSPADTDKITWPIDSVAATAGGFLRSLKLEREALEAPWITMCILSTGAWIDVGIPYGTPAERLDLIEQAADALGVTKTGVRYLPTAATLANVEVTGDWAECPITVRTSISTSDLVGIETDRAIAATTGQEFELWLERERRQEAADDDLMDRASESRGGDE